jgi:predicted ATPase
MLADLSTVSVRAIRDLERGRAKPRQDTVRLLVGALRLGRRATDDLESAAGGRTGGLREEYGPALAAPPPVLTPMFGRDAELGAVVREVAAGDGRLLTLHGLPGVGRTRLAAAVAVAVHRTGMPVLWVTAPDADGPLPQQVRDPRLTDLVGSVAAALFDAATAAPALGELLGDRDTLLVVDGVGDTPPSAGALVGMLGDCPGLRVVVTADRPCGLPGERPFLLAPLPRPTTVEPRLLAEEPAVRLFVHHARRRFDAVDAPDIAQVCALTDGLPPALAAAASWLDIYDLRTLHNLLHTNPNVLVSADLMARLGARVATLAPADRAALASLTGPARTLDEVAAATGRTIAAAGVLVRDLLQRGLLGGGAAVGGQSCFAVPSLVSALL